MKHLVVGAVCLIFGLVGLIVWWKTFGLVMRGVIPFTLVLGGIVAILSGWRRMTAEQVKAAASAANDVDAETDKAA